MEPVERHTFVCANTDRITTHRFSNENGVRKLVVNEVSRSKLDHFTELELRQTILNVQTKVQFTVAAAGRNHYPHFGTNNIERERLRPA